MLGQEIKNTDSLMSVLVTTAGFNTSILAFADSNIVKLNDGHFPVIGKAAFASSFNKCRDVKTIL